MPKFDCDGITSAMRSRTAMRSKLSCDVMICAMTIYAMRKLSVQKSLRSLAKGDRR